MRYGLFEFRNEVVVEDERFVSENGYEEIGKLLVPYYEIISRGVLELRSEDMNTYSADRENYVKALDNFPEVLNFRSNEGRGYIPLDEDKILVLSESQLRS